jgi:outer membrane protein TolC
VNTLFRVLVLATGAVTTAQAGPLEFDAAIERALRAAPELDRARALHDAAVARAPVASELADPELILGLDNLPVTGPDSGSLTEDFMTMRRVGVMQRFERGDKRRADRAAADAAVAMTAAGHDARRLEVARAAAAAWIDWKLDALRLNLLEHQRARYELHVAAADARIAGGGSAVEGITARRELAEFDGRCALAQGRVARSAAVLSRWLDSPVADSPGDLPGLTVLPEHAAATSPDTLPEVVELAQRAARARAQAERARVAGQPDWSLEASYAERGPLYSDMISIGVRIDLPLFAGRRQDREYAARVAERDAADAGLEALRRERAGAIAATRAEWESAGVRVARYRDSVIPLAREEAEVALAAYRGGALSLSEALDAAHSAERAGLDHLDALADQARAWVALRYLLPED